MAANVQGLLLAGINCSFSPKLKPNRIMYDRTAADSEQKMKIYSSASIAANPMLAVVFVSENSISLSFSHCVKLCNIACLQLTDLLIFGWEYSWHNLSDA